MLNHRALLVNTALWMLTLLGIIYGPVWRSTWLAGWSP